MNIQAIHIFTAHFHFCGEKMQQIFFLVQRADQMPRNWHKISRGNIKHQETSTLAQKLSNPFNSIITVCPPTHISALRFFYLKCVFCFFRISCASCSIFVQRSTHSSDSDASILTNVLLCECLWSVLFIYHYYTILFIIIIVKQLQRILPGSSRK